MIQTRDPRLEATFYDKRNPRNMASYWYNNKCLPRSVAKDYEAGLPPPERFTSSKNETDYPAMRYSEVLLNWLEAKAELAELGSGSVTQRDIDITINQIRDSQLAPKTIEM